ncbi:uncharacterized protein LOC113386424 [Ctenocephalides felis]|uniref:uncharacterized protein LOC113386424 n=1 Tax=Ctenocephalides felis TaxID=7515 RepID=UPI000E6E2433|nr:uncharacterized protein LOC113386424 [Ctenocephalides felis]
MSFESVALQQNYEIENDLTFLVDPKSSESVDYVFKDDEEFEEELLHDKSFMSNSSGPEPEVDTPTSSLIDEIEFTDGYFKRDLLPMLSKGHEGELCQYLKDIGVLKSSMKCATDSCEGTRMSWTSARVVDKYQWSCTKCKKRKSIREESFFKGMKFVLPIVLRAMQGWCGNYDPEELAQNMGLKPYAFRQVYAACREVAAKHIQNVLSNEILGGFNTVVILEVWSSGLKGAVVPIAGLIELKDKKIKYFYQPLRYNQQCSYTKEEPNTEDNKSKIINNEQNKSNIKKLLAKVQENETNNNTFAFNANKKRKNSDSSNSVDSCKRLNFQNENGLVEDGKIKSEEVKTEIKEESSVILNHVQDGDIKVDSDNASIKTEVKMEIDGDQLSNEPPPNTQISDSDTKPTLDTKPPTPNQSPKPSSKPRPSRSRSQKDLTGDLQTLIKQKVSQGSFLVLGNGVTSTVASNLMRSDLNMNAVKTLDMIRKVEMKDNPLADIITLLLQRPSEVISLAREIPRSQLQQFLWMHLWYDTYASNKNYTNNNSSGYDNNNLPGHKNNVSDNTLEVLLHQIASTDYGADAEIISDCKNSIEIILNEDS